MNTHLKGKKGTINNIFFNEIMSALTCKSNDEHRFQCCIDAFVYTLRP